MNDENRSEREQIFEQLWNGTIPMERWTEFVTGGAVTPVADDVITVHTTYFCGCTSAVRTKEGLFIVDTGNPTTADQSLAAVRRWDDGPVHTIVFTHGHVDHIHGAKFLDAEADERGWPRPRIIAHRNILKRFDRYEATHGFNSIVQGQQFNRPNYVYPTDHRRPDVIYDDKLSLNIGGVEIELFHGRGETDDTTYVWLPQKRIVFSGDFVGWVFPNAGNPRKVQRYAADWAAALRHMESLAPDVLVPGHGPVVFGAERAKQVLGDGASVLEDLNAQTIALMNEGKSLNYILQHVKARDDLLQKPYLLPKYDSWEFVVRGIWHLNGGWFDGNPANLKPADDRKLGTEIVRLVGGTANIISRALELARQGQTQLATQLVEYASNAEPQDKDIQRARAEIYQAAIDGESSLIGKNILGVFQRDAAARAE